MRGTNYLTLAAAGLLAFGLGACASGQDRSAETGTGTTAGGATASSSPSTTTSAEAGSPSRTSDVRSITDAQLRAYVAVLPSLEATAQSDPDLSRALQAGDLTGRRQDVETAIAALQTQSGTVAPVPSGGGATSSTATPDEPTVLTVDEFIRIHRQVQEDPALQARVQGLGPGGASGSTGAIPSSSPR